MEYKSPLLASMVIPLLLDTVSCFAQEIETLQQPRSEAVNETPKATNADKGKQPEAEEYVETKAASIEPLPSDYDDMALDEVVVTGQKLTRDLQQTVDSVTVITSEDMRKAGVQDVRDAFRLAPNINYSPSNNGNNGISIRGINSEGVGSPGTNQQALSTMVVDGAVQSTEGMRKGARGIWDLESVEVLRGPQISQGRNAATGSVIIKTKDPTNEYEVGGRLSQDSFGQDRALMLNTPLGDQLSFRFAAESVAKTKDINYTDPSLRFLAEEEFYSFRTKLLFAPTQMPDFSAMFTWSRAHDDPAIPAVSYNSYHKRLLNQLSTGVETRVNDVDNYILDLKYKTKSGIDLKSVTTFTDTATKFGTPSSSFSRDESRQDNDISQDFRATYKTDDGNFSVLMGTFVGNYRNTRDSLVKRLVPEVVTVENQVNITADSCVGLDMTAAGNGRWYDFFSDAYAQINQGFNGIQALDGFFLISNPGTQIGAGADVFPFEEIWNNVGTLFFDLSAFTGTGTETVPITGGAFNFSRYIADDDTVTNQGYTTTVLLNSGNATYVNGVLSDIDANFNVNFEYPGFAPWSGSLNLAQNGSFDLNAGDLNSAIGSVNFAWDFDGTFTESATPATCPAPGSTVTQTVRTSVATGRQVFQTFQDIESLTKRRNYAIYTESDWRFLKPLRLVSGFRYDYDETDYSELSRVSGVNVGGSGSGQFDAFLPKIGIVGDILPNLSVGFVVSRGYRSGFVDRGNQSAPVINIVKPEFIWSYEIPIRSEWMDGKLRANANFFKYDWTNQQIGVQDPVNIQLTRSVNAGKSVSYGAEFDVKYRPIDELTVGASFGMLKTRFKEFVINSAGENYNGNEFPEAPSMNGSLTANYYWPQGWFIGGDVTYLFSYYATANLANNLVVQGRTLLNLNAGYDDPNGHYTIRGEIRNALDRNYLTGRDINGGAYIGDPFVMGISGEFYF